MIGLVLDRQSYKPDKYNNNNSNNNNNDNNNNNNNNIDLADRVYNVS